MRSYFQNTFCDYTMYLISVPVGKYGKAVVAASRKAVQDNNIEALIKIIQVGDSTMK